MARRPLRPSAPSPATNLTGPSGWVAFFVFLALVFGAGQCFAAVPDTVGVPVTLTAADGVAVFGEQWAVGRPRAVVLLFHAADSNHAEYEPIVPLLVKAGFACIAIDQRAGGTMWGVPNLTVEKLGGSRPYLTALPDLEAALAWARTTYPRVPVYAVGSSYSSSLVFLLAQMHPKDVAAIAAFSPGEYFEQTNLVRRTAAQLTLPMFADSAATRDEIEAVRVIFSTSPAIAKYQYVPLEGIHGAATLREDRDPAGFAENRHALMKFFDSL